MCPSSLCVGRSLRSNWSGNVSDFMIGQEQKSFVFVASCWWTSIPTIRPTAFVSIEEEEEEAATESPERPLSDFAAQAGSHHRPSLLNRIRVREHPHRLGECSLSKHVLKRDDPGREKVAPRVVDVHVHPTVDALRRHADESAVPSEPPDEGDVLRVHMPQSGPLNHHPTRTPVRESLEEGEWHRGEELQEGDLRLEPRLRGKLRGLSSLRQTLQIDFE